MLPRLTSRHRRRASSAWYSEGWMLKSTESSRSAENTGTQQKTMYSEFLKVEGKRMGARNQASQRRTQEHRMKRNSAGSGGHCTNMAIRYRNHPAQQRKEFGVPEGNETESKEREVIPTGNCMHSPESPSQHGGKSCPLPQQMAEGAVGGRTALFPLQENETYFSVLPVRKVTGSSCQWVSPSHPDLHGQWLRDRSD